MILVQVPVLFLMSFTGEVMHEIGSCELEDIDVGIQLANRETIYPLGIVRDVEVLCGKTKYPTDFLVLGKVASKTCPIIFGRPFLNTCGAVIDCKKEISLLSLMENLMSLIFLSLPKPLMKLNCLMKILDLNSLPLLLLLLTMLCSNIWRTTKVRFSGKKEMKLTRFFFVSHSCLNTICLWRIWVPLCHPRKILFLI